MRNYHYQYAQPQDPTIALGTTADERLLILLLLLLVLMGEMAGQSAHIAPGGRTLAAWHLRPPRLHDSSIGLPPPPAKCSCEVPPPDAYACSTRGQSGRVPVPSRQLGLVIICELRKACKALTVGSLLA